MFARGLQIATDVVGLVDEWAARFFEELDYINEGENATRFAEQMRVDLPQVSDSSHAWNYLNGCWWVYFCETFACTIPVMYSLTCYSWPGGCTKDFYEIYFTASLNNQLDRRRKTLAKHCKRCRGSSKHWGYLLSETGRHRPSPLSALMHIAESSFMLL